MKAKILLLTIAMFVPFVASAAGLKVHNFSGAPISIVVDIYGATTKASHQEQNAIIASNASWQVDGGLSDIKTVTWVANGRQNTVQLNIPGLTVGIRSFAIFKDGGYAYDYRKAGVSGEGAAKTAADLNR